MKFGKKVYSVYIVKKNLKEEIFLISNCQNRGIIQVTTLSITFPFQCKCNKFIPFVRYSGINLVYIEHLCNIYYIKVLIIK